MASEKSLMGTFSNIIAQNIRHCHYTFTTKVRYERIYCSDQRLTGTYE